MLTVWKYQLEKYSQPITMPEGAVILCMQLQRGIPCIWALVDTECHRHVTRAAYIVDTGAPVPANTVYVGTYQERDGEYIRHVFVEK